MLNPKGLGEVEMYLLLIAQGFRPRSEIRAKYNWLEWWIYDALTFSSRSLLPFLRAEGFWQLGNSIVRFESNVGLPWILPSSLRIYWLAFDIYHLCRGAYLSTVLLISCGKAAQRYGKVKDWKRHHLFALSWGISKPGGETQTFLPSLLRWE